ncbi:response regulator transcription factor [Neolewinella agarilytica]|uniref:DNA-binding response regulator, OmpR family, contains REC and winged-helix (WHTH) domain n=1 Tax=Neolewinella agarilytica TaxID=478744 RepID=A0A1H9LFZ9_9BACT|nr:response regulator transcription factor [Neolewinella agarilytica]SER10422.1 DNA-binding response regulator, OmpR family, contains REC and winged-helix (wHTH) domain [Neolewinella agarilytica]
MSKANLLYVEDDESLSFVTRDNLELSDFAVTHCPDGPAALELIQGANFDFDLCLLDVMLPGIDGFELARCIREKNQDVPILFLTAKSLKEDRLQGLRLGADDYITKPFSIEELILKIEVFLRRNRVRPATPAFDPRRIGDYLFEIDKLQLQHKTEPARRLTRREAELLQYLSTRRDQVSERGDILEKIWGENDYFLGRSLDVFISRLRKYLKEDPRIKIENIHGVGFSLTVGEG